MDKHEEEFSRRMLAYLELLNMTQNDLAKKMDVSPASVTLWIQGKKSPRMDKIDKMCEIFNCTRNDLLGEVVASEYSAEERSNIQDVAPEIQTTIYFMKEMDEPTRRHLLAYAEYLWNTNKKGGDN